MRGGRFPWDRDFSDKRLEYGWTRRHLCKGEGRAVFFCNGGKARADTHGNIMALIRALLLWQEIDLDIGHVGSTPLKVMADETVEVERCGGA